MADNRVQRKIRSVSDMVRISEQLKIKGKIIVQCHGVFDLLHPGHIKYFNSAKREGDVLIVTLTADKYVKRGPGRPLFNETIRSEVIAALEVVDYVCVLHESTAINFIKNIKPNIYAKGPDYKNKSKDVTGKIYDEERAVKRGGGRLFITDDITFSSTSLINNHLDVFPEVTKKYLLNFADKYSIDDITSHLSSVRKLKVLVIGDAIIDQYHYSAQMGKSAKEPLVVSRYISKELFAGGALATANHVANLCDRVDLLTVLGSNHSYKSFIESHLAKNVKVKFFNRFDAGTTVKRRYVSKDLGRKLFEIYFMNDAELPVTVEKKVREYLVKVISKYDLVIVNDFGHGFLTPTLIKLLSSKAKKLALNVQTNSANAGFNLVTKYANAHFVCVDEMELRYTTHDRFGDLNKIVRKVHDQLACELTMTTRGSAGSVSYTSKQGFLSTPSFANSVVDAIGAGDAFFAYTAPCYAAEIPTDLIGFIGNVVGSLAVQIVGNRETVQYVDLIKFMTRLLK